MKSRKNIHVVQHPKGGWTTREEGSKRTGSRNRKQSTAIDTGRKKAKGAGVELVIHGTNGKIRDKDSYGNDPCPPKDKKH